MTRTRVQDLRALLEHTLDTVRQDALAREHQWLLALSEERERFALLLQQLQREHAARVVAEERLEAVGDAVVTLADMVRRLHAAHDGHRHSQVILPMSTHQVS